MSKDSLTNAQISSIIAKIENGSTNGQFNYLGIDFWPYIRISLIARLKVQHRAVKKSHKLKYVFMQAKETVVKIGQSFYYSYCLDRAANLTEKNYPTMLIAPYEHRFDKTKYGYLNKHADALRKASVNGNKIGLIEYSFSFKKRKKRASDSILLNFMPEYLALKYRFLSVFGKPQKFYDKNWLVATDRINRVFEKENINIVISVQNLLLEVQRVNELADYCEHVLTKFGVKHLINIVYCNYISIAFILAAKRLSLKTTEYQHGSQDETHPHYTNWSLIEKSGYTLLPENYWVWSENTLRYMRQWTDKTENHKVSLTGNFYITHYLSNVLSNNKKQKVILLTLQDPSLLPAFMFQVIEDTSKEWVWWIREHPRCQMSQEIWQRFLKLTGNQAVNVSQEHIYTLFPEVSVHMTGYSTCAFEAELFGIPTIFFDKHAQLGYKSLITQCEHLVYAQSAEQVFNSLEVLTYKPVTVSGFIEAATCSLDDLLAG